MTINHVYAKTLPCVLTRFFTITVAIYISSVSFSFAQLARPVSFAPATQFTVGTNPRYVAVGDFNGDGRPDLAVANFGSNNVSILLGTGNGAFGAATNFATETEPRSIAVGDFNADGNADLAVVNFGSPNVSILLGTGTGAFASATPFPVFQEQRTVTIGDFEGNGFLDLAVGDFILLGDGKGAFGVATPLNAANTLAVAAADLNRDGFTDLAVTNLTDNNVLIFMADRTGGFEPPVGYPVGTAPSSIAIGDLNGDGNLDLAVGNQTSNDVSILFGSGGTFLSPPNFAVGASVSSVEIADFNGDGNPDLAVGHLSGNSVTILPAEGVSGGGFPFATEFATEIDPRSVAAGDFNGDGKPDLAVANFGSNTVSILLNTTGADQEPPNTSITSGPVGTITIPTAAFSWTGSDNGPADNLVYAYRLDPIEASFSAYGSARMKSYANLSNGIYTFYVKAKDQAGNEDQTPDTRNFGFLLLCQTSL